MTVVPFPDDEPGLAEIRRYFEGWQPPSDEEWFKQSHNPVLPTIRIAWMTVEQTRAEVRETVKGLREEGMLDDLLERFEWTSGHFSPLVSLFEAAKRRLIENGAGLREET